MRPVFFKPTVIFIVACVAIITVYDVWAVAHNYEWTISATLLGVAQEWPIIPFLLGVLAGHLFFPNRAAGAAPVLSIVPPKVGGR